MRAKDKLRAFWSKKEKDVMLHFPLGIQTTSDARFLADIFNKKFEEEITKRGYDISTLKFSIEPIKGNQDFASQRVKNES